MSEEIKNQDTGFSKEQMTQFAKEAVKMAMAEKEEPEETSGDTGLMDNYPYVPPQENYEPQPPQGNPYEPPQYEQPYEPPQQPQQPMHDPRVDGLMDQVQQGAKNNAILNFNNGWNNLVNQNPTLGEYNNRASKGITEMLDQGMITTPEKMAASFLGEKALADMSNPPSADMPNIPQSHANANANAGGQQEKDFKDMSDEEFDEWESEHGNAKI